MLPLKLLCNSLPSMMTSIAVFSPKRYVVVSLRVVEVSLAVSWVCFAAYTLCLHVYFQGDAEFCQSHVFAVWCHGQKLQRDIRPNVSTASR